MDTMIKKIKIETSNSYSNLRPVYSAIINIDDNKVYYNGKLNVKKYGMHYGKIPSYFAELLVDFITSTCFLNMLDSYTSSFVDLSKTRITLFLKNGQSKSIIFDDLSKPSQLLAIKLMIDNALKYVRWNY